MSFGYLKDRLFLVCLVAYLLNRVLASQGISPPIFRSYLNDVICIPFWIPIMLWVQRKAGLREHDDPPRGNEIVIPLLIWAVLFEVILPATPTWSGLATADPIDVLCYAFGGLIAARFWSWWYGGTTIEADVIPATAP